MSAAYQPYISYISAVYPPSVSRGTAVCQPYLISHYARSCSKNCITKATDAVSQVTEPKKNSPLYSVYHAYKIIVWNAMNSIQFGSSFWVELDRSRNNFYRASCINNMEVNIMCSLYWSILYWLYVKKAASISATVGFICTIEAKWCQLFWGDDPYASGVIVRCERNHS